MDVILSLVLLLIVVLAVCYFFVPGPLVSGAMALLRSISGLKTRNQQVDGYNWCYLEGGPASAETVVMVHGFGADKDNWPLYARHFVKDYHVICPDLLGFGDSDKPLDEDYQVEAQVERLRKFLHSLGIRKFHLSGNSMGGYITQYYALMYPDELLSITLLDSAGVVGENKSKLEVAIASDENLLGISTMEDVDRLLALATYKKLRLPLPFKKVFFAKAVANQAVLNKVYAGLSHDQLHRTLNDRVADIKVPTMIIWGRHDNLIDVSSVPVLTRAIVGSKSVILEETGHVPMMEKPAITASHHLAFLSSLPRS